MFQVRFFTVAAVDQIVPKQQWSYCYDCDSYCALWPSYLHRLRVSCQKGPTCHAYAWQIGPFWQDILEHILHSDGELTFNQFSHQHWVSKNNLWRRWCQKQVSSVGINNYTAHFLARCNCLCLSYIPVCGTNVLLLYQNSSLIWTKSDTYSQGAVSIRKTVLPGMAIPMLKIRRPNGRLIFNMEIAIHR